MQNENRPFGSRNTRFGSGKMPCQDDSFIDAWIAEKAVGRLSGSPVLASRRQRRADLFAQLTKQLREAILQSQVWKLTPFHLPFDPGFHAGSLQRWTLTASN